MIQRWKKKKAWLQKEKNNVTWKKKALDQIKKRKRTSDLLKTHQRSKDFAKIKVEYIFSTISSSGFLMSTIRKRIKTHETHTHINTKSIPNCPNNIKKALSLIPNIVNVDSTPTIIIVRAASRLYVDKRSIILGIRIDFIKLYTLSLHDGFRRA